jgi:hypothetical protein
VTQVSDDDFTLESARAAARADELERWVHDFLSSPGSDNAVLANELCSPRHHWAGPLELPFAELHRLAGPPDQPTLAPLDDDDLERVDDMEESLDDGWEPPPLIVSYRDGQLVVEDGNHRIEGLRRAGEDHGWSLVCFTDRGEREQFLRSR